MAASRTGGTSSSTASRIHFSPRSTTLPASSSGSAEASRESSSASASTSTPRQEAKPLKGILMHQGLKSQDATPSSSPRTVPDTVHFQTPLSDSHSARKPDLQSSTQKGRTSSAVADFLRKFSPKLNRSKKTLHWYTVDIQPSVETFNPGHENSQKGNAIDLDSDPTIRNLQNGRISSEFSSEMSECLARRLDEKPRTIPPALPAVPPPSTRGVNSRTAQDRVDFLTRGTPPKTVTMTAPSVYGSPISKSMPTTPVAHMQHRDQPNTGQEWRMLMVDINVDKKDSANQIYGGGKVSNGLESRTYFQDSTPHLDRRDDGHVPSYIRLSRALNGYSARNMYSSKKLVNSRDYNVLLCRSEEFLNRPVSRSTTPAIRTDLIRSEEKPSGTQSARESVYTKSPRRAVSEGRDLRDAFADAENIPKLHSAVKEAVNIKEGKPGHEFLRKLDYETTALRDLVVGAQAELNADEKNLTENEREHLLSAVGKTSLLLNQKCRQFEDLCRKNIDELPDEKIKTTFSDLEGFWDLINIQITNCRRMFDDRTQFHSANDQDSFSKEATKLSGAATDSSGQRVGTPDTGVLKQGGSRRPSADISSPAGRRSSKPKVTFQLTERDVQRKEMIAAKRREFEQQQQQQSKMSVDVIDTPSVAGPGHDDVHIYVASNSSSE